MGAENWNEIERRHFESTWEGQIVFLQAFFHQFENVEVQQLMFRELFRVCFY